MKFEWGISGSQKKGVVVLLLLIVMLQLFYHFFDFRSSNYNFENSDAIAQFQKTIDSLKILQLEKQKPKIFPFNPNYLTDYKGYTLGMSVEEIDRLRQFRDKNKFINSAKEFQQVTKISDSLLKEISPFFKFPDWVVKKRSRKNAFNSNNGKMKREVIEKKDLNGVTAEELKRIKGIGEKLSERIIKYRDILGGFLVDEQLFEVYYLDSLVAKRALEYFTVKTVPSITKLDINMATMSELASTPYINYKLAKKIVTYRSSVGMISSFDELTKIEDFPAEKINRIALYLTIK
ncbi:ComEA family DNA-binding protein [Sungkyunkwania multivorans]|uniref:ComEA family DNA-binding protein n=1 Tax=Sungkyunkwania multivorans TaxID=1173618 RepID=A0ABW3CXP8_9FLAO